MSLFIQPLLDLHDEIIVDLFAGGGGASCGIEMATGRLVDVAVNHDPKAVDLHEANHPQTRHYVADVFEVDPRAATGGRPVGLLWASPDCTHHSKARGGKPLRDAARKRRALAWVVTRWAGQAMPRVIALENVEEFAQWGPLRGPKDALKPCHKRRGKTFRRWVWSLRRLGYQVEWKELRACDYGAPTIRKRLFVIARRDGQPIVWPEKTHGAGLKPYRTASECIDWSIPMCSIFATKEEAKAWAERHGMSAPVRPLAENTMRRIARGVMRFVVNNPKPFLVTLAHGEQSNGKRRWGRFDRSLDEPMTAVKCSGGDALVAPCLSTYYGGDGGEERGQVLDAPVATITSGGSRHALVAAFLGQENAGFYDGGGRPLDGPMPTILANGAGHNPLVAAHIQRDFGTSTGQAIDSPLGTITTEGGGKAALVASFLAKYYGTGESQSLDEPLDTVKGIAHVIVDIAMRMLTPRELYRCQGFPDAYVIDRGASGARLTKSEQVRMVGNSVCPDLAAAIVRANCKGLVAREYTRAA